MFNQIGIDVGGTYTDAVFINDGHIQQTAKVPTKSENILETLLEAFDALNVSAASSIDRINVSTTLVTNAILQNQLHPVKLFLFPGNGMDIEALPWPVNYHSLSGELDFRGREIETPDRREWERLIKSEFQDSSDHVAIVGKFSHRNSSHEIQLAEFLRKCNPSLKIALGHEWGQANFYRRSLTTYLNLGVSELYQRFMEKFRSAVRARNIQAPIAILKADGGIVPLEKLRPMDSIYSGPAASVLGALAQNEPADSSIVVDIGGTTTDLGLILSGNPLLSSKGAKIGAFSTLVRSLAVRSIPVGGDSVIHAQDQSFVIENYRLGPAYCLGGVAPTPTDAMRYLGLINYGNEELAEEAMASLLSSDRRTPQFMQEMAAAILESVVERIADAIFSLKREWQEEPAYKVWEVLHPHEPKDFCVMLSGGAAKGIVKALENRLKTPVQIGVFSEVGNAIGAAAAKATFDCTLHLDTYMKHYFIEETGEQGTWTGSLRPYREVEEFLDKLAKQYAARNEISFQDVEKDPFDFFPIVHSYKTVGQIVRGAVHIRPGVIGRVTV